MSQEMDDYWLLILSNFLTLRAGMANGAGKVLEDAGFQKPDLPALDEPPGGLDQLLWEVIWFEALADAASTFARANPTPEVAGAALSLAYLARMTKALEASGGKPAPVIEAAVYMALATARHINANRQALPLEKVEAELNRHKAGLERGPEAKAEKAKYWTGKVRAFTDEFYGTDRQRLPLTGATVWKSFNEQNPIAAETAKRLGKDWPTDGTAIKFINGLRKTKLG